MNENVTYLTVIEYAEKVGITKQAVYQQIKQKKIQFIETIDNGKIIKRIPFNGETAILQNATPEPPVNQIQEDLKQNQEDLNQSKKDLTEVNQNQEPVKESKVEPVNQIQEEVKQSKAYTDEYIEHLEAEISALREQLKSSQEQNAKLTETLNTTLQVAAQAQQITTQAQYLHKLASAPVEEEIIPPVPQEDKPGFFKKLFNKKNKGSV